MTRTHSGSLAAGGLNWDSLPLKLFAGGNAKFWNPADIDFSRDRADWERLTERRTRLRHPLVRAVHRRRGSGHRGHPAVHVRDARRGTARRRDVPDAVRFRRGQAHPGVPDVARRRRHHRGPARLSRHAADLSQDLLRGAPGLPQRVVDRPVAGRPDPGVGHLQPHRRGHVGADRLLRAGTRSAWTAASCPVCRSWSAASATTSGATWRGAPSPAGATSPPMTPTGAVFETRMNEMMPLALTPPRRLLRCMTRCRSACDRTS